MVNTHFPDRAALVLSSSRDSAEDGLLQVREIRDLSLNAELVTLSACDSGNGKLLGEEGIASLERAFPYRLAKECVRGLPVRLFVATNGRPLSLGLSGHEEFEETIQTLFGHLLLYVVPGGERLYRHEVAREFAPHRRIFVGRRSPSCPPEDQ